jgi:hypothetical protein
VSTVRRRVVIAALVSSLVLAACGNRDAEVVAPRPVPEGLVPAMVLDNKLGFHASGLEAARRAFAEAGPLSLASDGRLWEMRLGDRLVGILQLTTLMPEVDLQDESHRDAITRQLLPSVRDRIDIGDIAVWTATTQGKTTYLWFGKRMFALLTVKPGSEDDIDTEAVLEDVLDHMVAADGWVYEYFDDLEEA